MSTVVCLHGLGSSRDSFAPLAALLRRAGHAVDNRDLPGFGARAGETLDAEDPFAACVEEYLDRLKDQDDLCIIGHSMGSAVALPLAQALGPRRVVLLALLEGNLVGADCGFLSRSFAACAPEGLAAHKQAVIGRMRASPHAGWRNWAREARDVAPETFRAWSLPLVARSGSGELLDAFRAWRGRRLYVYGEEYKSAPVLEALSGVDVAYIPRAGHFVMYDDAPACAAAILERLP